MRSRRRALALVAALGLVLAACGGGDDATTTAGATDPEAPPTTAASTPDDDAPDPTEPAEAPVAEATFLPDIEVVDVASGEAVALRSLASADRPTLLWFWAPHCTFCMREAPDVVGFSASHGDELQIIGLGAQDDLDQAAEFLELTGTGELDMVWDATGETWIHFGITNQPTVVVVSPEGEVQATWFREFDEAGILDAAGLS
jgi:thiol-disulfide isomerase/thioredoxin